MKQTSESTAPQRIFIWLLVLLLPLLYSRQTIEPGSHLKVMFVSAILLIFLVYNYLKRPAAKVTTNIVITGFTCFAFYSIIGLFGNNFPDALFDWYKLVLVLMIGFVFSNFIQWKIISSELPKAFTILALVLVAAGIRDLVGLMKEGVLVIPGNTYSLQSFFGHRNLFAQMLFFTLPFSIYALVFSRDNLWRILSFSSVMLSLFFLIILSNRATWIALIIGSLVVVATTLFFLKFHKFRLNGMLSVHEYKRLIVAIVIGLVFAAGFYLKYSDMSSVKEHTADIVNFDKGSTKDHLSLWKKSLELIHENPMVGDGLASWKVEILKYGNEGLVSENNTTFYQTPHNDFLWICCEQGFVGLTVYILIVIIIAFNIIKNMRNASEYAHFCFMTMLQFLFIGYVVYSFFSFPKERLEEFMILGILAGCSGVSSGQKQFSFTGIGRHLLILSTCVILIGGVFLGFSRYKSEIHLSKALKAKAGNNYPIIIREINKSVSGFYKMDPVSTPLKWYSGSALFNLGRYPEALVDLKLAYELNPYHIHVLNNLASCYEMLGDHQSAIKLYKSAVAIAPNFEDVWLNLCAIYFNLKDTDKAYEALKQVDFNTKNPKFPQYIQVVLQSRLMEAARKNKNEKMQAFLNEKTSDVSWFLNLHINSIKQHRSPESIINNQSPVKF